MENNKDRTIEIELEDGEKVEGKILFTFEANGDDFVLYELKEQVFAAKVDDNNNLKAVEEDEWPLVEKVFKEYMEDTDEDEVEDE